MKGYIKPLVLELDDLAEGIYAASGDDTGKTDGNGDGDKSNGGEIDYNNDPECWIPEYRFVQREAQNPTDHYVIYEVKGTHKTGLQHISRKQRCVITLNVSGIDGVDAQGYPVTVSGNTIEFEREVMGDAYNSGDNFTVNVRFNCPTSEMAAQLEVNSFVIYCTHQENVQGYFD